MSIEECGGANVFQLRGVNNQAIVDEKVAIGTARKQGAPDNVVCLKEGSYHLNMDKYDPNDKPPNWLDVLNQRVNLGKAKGDLERTKIALDQQKSAQARNGGSSSGFKVVDGVLKFVGGVVGPSVLFGGVTHFFEDVFGSARIGWFRLRGGQNISETEKITALREAIAADKTLCGGESLISKQAFKRYTPYIVGLGGSAALLYGGARLFSGNSTDSVSPVSPPNNITPTGGAASGDEDLQNIKDVNKLRKLFQEATSDLKAVSEEQTKLDLELQRVRQENLAKGLVVSEPSDWDKYGELIVGGTIGLGISFGPGTKLVSTGYDHYASSWRSWIQSGRQPISAQARQWAQAQIPQLLEDGVLTRCQAQPSPQQAAQGQGEPQNANAFSATHHSWLESTYQWIYEGIQELESDTVVPTGTVNPVNANRIISDPLVDALAIEGGDDAPVLNFQVVDPSELPDTGGANNASSRRVVIASPGKITAPVIAPRVLVGAP